MRQRFIPFLIFGLIIIVFSEWNVRTKRFESLNALDENWRDFCLANSSDSLATPAVTVVKITDDYEPPLFMESRRNASDPPVLTRLDFANIFESVQKLQPRSVAFVPTPRIDESHALNQPDVVPLKETTLKLPRLTLATVVTDNPKIGDRHNHVTLNYSTITTKGDPSTILSFTKTIQSPDSQMLPNGNPAFKSIESAKSLLTPTALRIPLVASYQGSIVSSFVLSAIADHAGIPIKEIVLDLTDEPELQIGDLRPVPILPDGTFILPQHSGIKEEMKGAHGAAAFTSLSVDELAYTGGSAEEQSQRIPADLPAKFQSIRENLVVIGFDRDRDQRIPIASGGAISETVLLSRAIATIQSGRFLSEWPAWLRFVAMVLIVAIAAALFRLRRSHLVPLWGIAVLAFFGLSVVYFQQTLNWTPPFFAFGLFGLILILGLLIPLSKGEETEDYTISQATLDE